MPRPSSLKPKTLPAPTCRSSSSTSSTPSSYAASWRSASCACAAATAATTSWLRSAATGAASVPRAGYGACSRRRRTGWAWRRPIIWRDAWLSGNAIGLQPAHGSWEDASRHCGRRGGGSWPRCSGHCLARRRGSCLYPGPALNFELERRDAAACAPRRLGRPQTPRRRVAPSNSRLPRTSARVWGSGTASCRPNVSSTRSTPRPPIPVKPPPPRGFRK